MIILVTANNFLQMFVGWEGVGLSSYLLINFWFTRIQANKAAIKAMLINRVGDFGLLLAMFLIYLTFESLDYDTIFSLSYKLINYRVLIGGFEFIVIDLISILLFIGAMGKSAQLGLHTWLPDAMEGPTPVSALIHAATMVTAGVFLITRCSFIIEYSTVSLNFISFIGAFTALFAATTGLFQNDLKKIIAYSTCSQLGYMVFACGLSSYDVGIFHLSNHAFFKALLFLCAGCVIHAVNDEQDLRKLGGLKRLLPFSYSTMLIGSLALAGFPFLSGFYSKDVILELAYAKYSAQGHFCYYLGLAAAFCTAFYSARLLYLTFLAEPNGVRLILLKAHEPSYRMSIPLVVLTIFSCLFGFTFKDLFIGFGSDFWIASIFFLPSNYTIVDIEFISITYKLLPLILTILSFFLVYVIYSYYLYFFYVLKKIKSFQYLYTFFNKKWYFDRIYNQYVSQSVLSKSYFLTYQTIDRGFIEQIGPYGAISLISTVSTKILNTQVGYVVSFILLLNASILSFTLLSSTFLLFNLKFYIFFIIQFIFLVL
jgi:NADH-ubiquinone oxidoreductase chain 5